MNQEQPRGPGQQQEERGGGVGGGRGQQQAGVDPIKYGDVFAVSGEMASEIIAPQDAAMMQSAEASVLGQPKRGGPADAMRAAAGWNERAGVVGGGDISSVAANQGITVAENQVPGGRVVTEKVGGQIVGQYVEPTAVVEQRPITIGEALDAAGQTASEKLVDRSDAAAIQAAEQRVTASHAVIPGGLAASAQAAAAYNEGTIRDDEKIKLSDVLAGASAKLPGDRVAGRQDVEGVVNAELRAGNKTAVHHGGVAASVAAAVRLNESMRNP